VHSGKLQRFRCAHRYLTDQKPPILTFAADATMIGVVAGPAIRLATFAVQENERRIRR